MSAVDQSFHCRYFISYTGTGLPLKLLNELDDGGLENRITYFAGYYDDQNRLRMIEKIVYDEIEFTHHYEYENDRLIKATLIVDDEEPCIMSFDAP